MLVTRIRPSPCNPALMRLNRMESTHVKVKAFVHMYGTEAEKMAKCRAKPFNHSRFAWTDYLDECIPSPMPMGWGAVAGFQTGLVSKFSC